MMTPFLYCYMSDIFNIRLGRLVTQYNCAICHFIGEWNPALYELHASGTAWRFSELTRLDVACGICTKLKHRSKQLLVPLFHLAAALLGTEDTRYCSSERTSAEANLSISFVLGYETYDYHRSYYLYCDLLCSHLLTPIIFLLLCFISHSTRKNCIASYQ